MADERQDERPDDLRRANIEYNVHEMGVKLDEVAQVLESWEATLQALAPKIGEARSALTQLKAQMQQVALQSGVEAQPAPPPAPGGEAAPQPAAPGRPQGAAAPGVARPDHQAPERAPATHRPGSSPRGSSDKD